LQAELVNQVEKHLISIMHGVSVSILLFSSLATC
jgi:transcription initiation factor TFIID subunit 7